MTSQWQNTDILMLPRTIHNVHLLFSVAETSFFSLAKEHIICRNFFLISLASWELDRKIRAVEGRGGESKFMFASHVPQSQVK